MSWIPYLSSHSMLAIQSLMQQMFPECLPCAELWALPQGIEDKRDPEYSSDWRAPSLLLPTLGQITIRHCGKHGDQNKYLGSREEEQTNSFSGEPGRDLYKGWHRAHPQIMSWTSACTWALPCLSCTVDSPCFPVFSPTTPTGAPTSHTKLYRNTP